ncbi:small ribosomal subunit protein uS5-like [Hypanus sabinus]|uniref:small ribosomal subunit protein uS5-like n=1 Tax=Hypanus sabinus TaxID=79690 RepID=UPI0028C4228E|nr:small ribosomal subunit protein uS5-like [Hypanus sabinus]
MWKLNVKLLTPENIEELEKEYTGWRNLKSFFDSPVHWWEATKENIKRFFIRKGIQKARQGQGELRKLQTELQQLLLLQLRGVDVREELQELGRLVKDMNIKTLEEIYLCSLPIKSEIIDFFLGSALKDEVLKIMPVQKQTCAGQHTRFKAFVAIGDYNGHIGLDVKCSKEVATAIRGAIILAKLSIIPVRRGYWGNKIGKPHTVPCKMTDQCGSVLVRLICAPRGLPVVSAPVPTKLLQMAGIDACCTSARGCTATLGNFDKATFNAFSKVYSNLTPDLWKETVFTMYG